jgi:hypothetical protein
MINTSPEEIRKGFQLSLMFHESLFRMESLGIIQRIYAKKYLPVPCQVSFTQGYQVISIQDA